MTTKDAGQIGKEINAFREQFLVYTRKAYRLLPRMEGPRILDLGCSDGFDMLELARLSDGEIIGIDIDQPAIEKLQEKIKEANLSGRLSARVLSFKEIDYGEASFDILWSEGSIQFIGFEKGLKEWRRLLKPGGFLIIHAAPYEVKFDAALIESLGYEMFDQFDLPENTWWDEYYKPIEGYITKLPEEASKNPRILKIIAAKQSEIDIVKKNPAKYQSGYMILKKKDLK